MVLKIKVPSELKKADLIKSFQAGLHCISVGQFPLKVARPGDDITTHIQLSAEGEKLWNELLPEFESKRELARTALSKVRELPTYCRNCF